MYLVYPKEGKSGRRHRTKTDREEGRGFTTLLPHKIIKIIIKRKRNPKEKENRQSQTSIVHKALPWADETTYLSSSVAC